MVDMDVFITNESALEFWSLYRRSKENRVFRPCRRKAPCESPDSSALRRGEAWGLTLPLDIMVGETNARRPSKALRPHVCLKLLPDGAFLKVDNGLYVGSPEFCFLQKAGEYPLARLIALGTELCGTYSLPNEAYANVDQDASAQAMFNLPQLTNIKKLKAFVARMGGWTGHGQAMKALHYVAENSASPMETILFLLLTLPYRYGGYGLPKPEMNGRIYPEKGVKRFSGKSFYRCDLLWREDGVVAEYNSDLEHAGPERLAMDAVRRNDLALCGFFEITVTKRQVKNLELLDKIAKQIATRLGKRLQYNNEVFSKAQEELHSILL